ncbi:hypothetical protein K501DRAFT_329134, partial [Backusella circina FSU 941]
MSDSPKDPETIPNTTTELREDLIKSAVSFLTSPNVQAADKGKKIAFLQKKGLNQAEIDEAFKRTGGDGASTTVATTTTTSNPTPSTTTVATKVPSSPLPPVLPQRNVTYAPQQVLYLPQPPAPPMPFEKVFVMAVVLGMGTVGITAGVIGIFKRLMGPIFQRIIEYKRNRYNQHKHITEKMNKSLGKFNSENDDLDAVIDQGEEETVTDALVKHQRELQMKLEKLISKAKERVNIRKTYRLDGGFELLADSESSNAAASGLKSDIRSLKALLLNRRSFPI